MVQQQKNSNLISLSIHVNIQTPPPPPFSLKQKEMVQRDVICYTKSERLIAARSKHRNKHEPAWLYSFLVDNEGNTV